MEKRRITTVKARLKQITTGRYIQQEGFNPNYVLSPSGSRLSRVRILATVVDKFLSESGKFASLTLDDGTDTIRAKVFNAVSMFETINPGDIVDVIGRVRSYNEEIYVMPEVITKSDPNFELLRELELQEQEKEQERKRALVLEYKNQVVDADELKRLMKERFGIEEEETESLLSAVPEEAKEDTTKETIMKLIESLDKGSGCDYNELMEASQLPEEIIDKVVEDLLTSGLCYEPKPGKIKKL